jgi:hypothetical protein
VGAVVSSYQEAKPVLRNPSAQNQCRFYLAESAVAPNSGMGYVSFLFCMLDDNMNVFCCEFLVLECISFRIYITLIASLSLSLYFDQMIECLRQQVCSRAT